MYSSNRPKPGRVSRLKVRAQVRRGIFQCVKYQSVLEAQRHYLVTDRKLPDVRVFLVLANEFPGDLRAIRDLLDVKVIARVAVPGHFEAGAAAV